MTKQPPLPWKVKLGLIAFGGVAALAVSIVAVQLVPSGPKGTEFESIEDVRRAMLRDDEAESDATNPEQHQPASLRTIVRPHPSDRLIYTLKPNLDLTFIRARVRTNSCGMRSPERPVAKSPGTYRIALLGDSFTFGWGVEENETFAHHLEQTMNRLVGEKTRVEVLNFGVPGYSTFQEVELFKELALDFQPDAVLVYFVENDFGMPFFIRNLDGSGGLLSSLKFVQLGQRLLDPGQVHRQVEALGLDPNRALQELERVTSEHGIKAFFTINPKKKWKSYLKRLWAINSRSSLQFVPLRQGLMEYVERHNIPEKDLTLSFDPHPSPLRHRMLGNLLASYLVEEVG